MPTGDGLLVRLRLTGGIVDIVKARAIAACAMRHGNGLIDLSSRANLQLRGVRDAALPELTAELERLGILDASAEAETIRNVTASPLAGIDPTAVLDIRPLAVALEARLTGDSNLHLLPGKFGFLIDDGGALPMFDISADVRFQAIAAPNGPRFVIMLDGGSTPVAECEPAELTGCAAALAQAFLTLREQAGPAPRRMRDLVRCVGEAAIARAAGLAMPRSPPENDRPFEIDRVIGHHRISELHYVGVAAPFGRFSGRALDRLADVAARHGATELRLTPWRAMLIAGISADAAEAVLAELHDDRFILDAADPRLHVAGCPGAPACNSATTPVQQDAERFIKLFAPWASAGTALHVSGCAKGCAHARVAPFTLVGHDSRYDLIENGCATDTPVAMHLAPDEVEAELARRLTLSKERLLAKLP